MSVESEAVLEAKLIDRLSENGYQKINIKNEEELNANFKVQLEKLNRRELTDEEFNRVLQYLDSGTIFDKAKKLRDHFYIEREEESFFI